MIRLRFFNKKIKLKLYIKTQNTKYRLKVKNKKNGAKPRPNIYRKTHKKTIRHNNEIAFTQQSTITSFSNKQRDTKQTAATIEI